MAEYSSGSIYFSGLGNGTDFSSMIDSLKEIEMAHSKQLMNWRKDWTNRKDAFADLRTTLSSYSTFLKTMDTEGEFTKKKALSSNTQIASVACTSSAQSGQHIVLNVKELASNSYATIGLNVKDKAAQIVSESTGPQTFEYTYKDKTRSFTLDKGTTLAGLQARINNDPQNPGVRAELVQSANGYVLQMVSKDQGAQSAIKVSENQWLKSLTTDGAGEWNYVTGKNAKLSINGSPPIERSSNVIDDYAGLKITLVGTGSSTITVETDTEAITENVKKFIEETNKVRAKFMELTKVNGDKNTVDITITESQQEAQKGSVLTGNYGVQLMDSNFKNMIPSRGVGFDSLADVYSTLTQLGIKTDAKESSETYGMLIYDQTLSEDDGKGGKITKFEKAIRDNPDAVAELFSANAKPAQNNKFTADTMPGFTKGGEYKVTYDVDSEGKISNAWINGKKATINNETKTISIYSVAGQEPNPADGTKLFITDLEAKSHETTLRVKDGKVPELINLIDYDMLARYPVEKGQTSGSDSFTHAGSLSILERQYQGIIDNIDKKLLREQERVDKWERTTRQRFSRLDATLKQYDSLNSQISSQIKQLPGSSGK